VGSVAPSAGFAIHDESGRWRLCVTTRGTPLEQATRRRKAGWHETPIRSATGRGSLMALTPISALAHSEVETLRANDKAAQKSNGVTPPPKRGKATMVGGSQPCNNWTQRQASIGWLAN
jgi:hypothetical protein